LGERIKIIRDGLSQEDFGYLFDVHRTTVHAWECNEIMPGDGIIKAFFMLFPEFCTSWRLSSARHLRVKP